MQTRILRELAGDAGGRFDSPAESYPLPAQACLRYWGGRSSAFSAKPEVLSGPDCVRRPMPTSCHLGTLDHLIPYFRTGTISQSPLPLL